MFELGNNLREARQRRQVDLVAAEQDTKIRSKYLAALESEDFDVLPGPVFVRGFLRTYSRYLDLDPQMFVDEYNARFGRFEEAEEQAHSLGRPGLAQQRASRGRRTMRVAVVLSLMAIAAFAWLGLRQDDAPPAPDPEPRISGERASGNASATPTADDASTGVAPAVEGGELAASADAAAATPAR